ncbi:MAG: MurT ligase domain-containing protein, partial [Patescibacteria group bacterium]|nr:MurT ligase domain-containing protein [Patescibacteria group bacterium]
LNGDDPLVSSLKRYVEGEVIFFGINDKNLKAIGNAAMDSKDCLNCGHELLYDNRYLGHLGDWKCPNCGEKRENLKYFVSDVDLKPNFSTFVLNSGKEDLKIKMPMPGLYNIYNGLAAAAASLVLGIASPAISHSLHNCEAAFGRMEIIDVNNKRAMLLLVKNPTGASQALSAIFSDGRPKKIGLFLNDNFADGTDVSWIWDVDFETFNLKESTFVVSGIRAEDMALRLKYAGIEGDKIIINKNLVESVTVLTSLLDRDEMAYILPTYTAMIEIRGNFASKNDDLCNMGKITKRGI